MKIFQGQHQGQMSQLPLRTKICIAVTETEYAYLIKTMQKNRFVAVLQCSMLKIILKIKSFPSQIGHRAALISVSIALSTTLHCEASDSGLSTFITHCVPDIYPPNHRWMARLS